MIWKVIAVAYISPKLKLQVIERARGLCEYCQSDQTIVITMEIDHIVPVSVGGQTDLDNLCLTCAGCNSFKQDFQTGVDPQTDEPTTLFNPRTQNWHEHFQWDHQKTQLMGLTAIGRATIIRLKINRAEAVRARERWVKAGLHPPD